jgi:hypothetical protein
MPTPPSPREPGSGPHRSDPGRRGCPGRVTRHPLPDPSAVHLRPVPSAAPPYDDELLPPLPAATPRPAARPPRQLSTWTTERAKSRIQRMAPLLAAGHPPRLRRVLATHPARGVIEMTIIIAAGPRTRALAIRLEHTTPPRPRPGRPPQPAKWICTDIEAA